MQALWIRQRCLETLLWMLEHKCRDEKTQTRNRRTCENVLEWLQMADIIGDPNFLKTIRLLKE